MELTEKDLIDEIISVLEYYADEKTYHGQAFGYEWVAPIEHDEGKRAKAVLGKIRNRIKEEIKKSFLSGGSYR
jgi:predicted PilT family ATPase